MLPETGQGFLALQVRSADADAMAAVGDAEGATRAAGRARRAPRCSAAGAARRSRPTRSRWPTGGCGCAPGSRCPTARASSRPRRRGDDPDALAAEVAGAALGRGGEEIVAAVRA